MSKRNKGLKCALVATLCFLCFAPKSPSVGLNEPWRADTLTNTLIINEYLADPPDGAAGDANGDGIRNSAADEFIEVVNDGPLPLPIAGYTISDADRVRFTVPAGKIIPPGEAALIFGGGQPMGAFGNVAANGLVFTAGGGLSLNNSGDSIIVKDNLGATVASIVFGSAEGNANQSITRIPDIVGTFGLHSEAPGGTGLFSPGTILTGEPFTEALPVITSLVPSETEAGSGPVTIAVNGGNFDNGAEVRAGSSSLTTSFVSSTQLNAELPVEMTDVAGDYAISVMNPGGTFSNTVTFVVRAPVVLSPIGINEYLADPPDGIVGDANGDGQRNSADDEFVEIVNRTESPLDVSEYTLSDASQVRFRFPSNTTIPAGEAAVIFGGGNPVGDFGNAQLNGLVFRASLSLNNGGDSITIRDPLGNVVESVTFGAAEGGANQSLNRNPDLSGTTFVRHSTIPDSSGALFSPGTRTSGAEFTIGPRITGITPDSANLGDPPFTINVTGSGFASGSLLLIGASPVENNVLSEAELSAVVPTTVTTVAGTHEVIVRNPGGGRSNVALLTIIRPPPTVHSIRPNVVLAGSGSFELVIAGNGFDSPVLLVEGNVIETRVISENELVVTIPAALCETEGTRRVIVRNRDGQESNGLTFEVVPPGPQIHALLPQETLAGTPDFILTVVGSNFSDRSVVWFGAVPLSTNFVSVTQLDARVPGAEMLRPGLVAVTVRSALGAGSNEAPFLVKPIAPRAGSVSPSSAVEGSGEIAIKVSGELFQPGAVVRASRGLISGIRLPTEFISTERLASKLPAELTRTPGRLVLTIENPDFGISGELRFDVVVMDSIVLNEYLADPPPSLLGDANGDGNRSSSQDEFVEIVNRAAEPIDVSGYRLHDSEAARHVFAAGTVIPPFEAVVVFGGGRPSGSFGNAAENGLVFTASTGGLSLNNGGDVIRLEDGSGRLIQEITFGNQEGTAQQSINRDPDVDGAVFVRHLLVSVTNKLLFSPGMKAEGSPFTDKPFITRVSPSSTRLGSGALELLVSGSNFVKGAEVLLDERSLETTYQSTTELRADVPAELLTEGGKVDLRVRNPRGELSSGSVFLIVDDPPHLTSITPERTSTGAENLEVTITGHRLQRGCEVIVDGELIESKLNTIVGSTTELRLVLPARFFVNSGQLVLRVRNADGNVSNEVSLSVDNGPLITKIGKKKIKVGRGAVQMVIGGIVFTPESTLFVDESAVPTIFVSDTELAVQIPAEKRMLPGRLTIQVRNRDGGRSNKATIKVIE